MSPVTANRAPSQVTRTTNAPGSSTWAESRTAWTDATRTPATRTCADCSTYRPRKTFSPPRPRSTRSPATVSDASVVSFPDTSRCADCAACSGRITRPRAAVSTGTPTATTTASVADDCQSRATTTT